MSERPVIVELTAEEAGRLFDLLADAVGGPEMSRRPQQWFREEWAEAELEIGALGALARALGAEAPSRSPQEPQAAQQEVQVAGEIVTGAPS